MTYRRLSSGTGVITKENLHPHRDFAGIVGQEYIDARRMNETGAILGDVYGTCGEVVLVNHKQFTAAYYHDELVIL